jgi:phage terminase small subunit
MPNLTTKQEKFCQLLVTESKTLTDAYKAAYNCENMQIDSIYQLSSRLSKQVHIRFRINQLTEQISNDAVSQVAWDRSKIINELSINVSLGRENGAKQLAASNQAINLIGKAINVFEPETTQLNSTVSVIHSLSDAVLEQLASISAIPVPEPIVDDTGTIEASYQILEDEPEEPEN